MLRDQKFVDSPLEGRVHCELVSEMRQKRRLCARKWDEDLVIGATTQITTAVLGCFS